MPHTYRDIIHIYNETYSVSMRVFAFDILQKMVLNVETVLPKVKEHLTVGRMYVATVEPFQEFFDEYYGTRYKANDDYSKKIFLRNYIEILQLLKASLRLDAKETNEEEKARKKAFLDEKIAWFNKHYRRYTR